MAIYQVSRQVLYQQRYKANHLLSCAITECNEATWWSLCHDSVATHSDDAEPAAHILEGVAVGHVIHDNKCVSTAEVHRRQSTVEPGASGEGEGERERGRDLHVG